MPSETLDRVKLLRFLRSDSARTLIRSYIEAKAFAAAERRRVDAYVRPIFDSYRFPVSRRRVDLGEPEFVNDPDLLFRCEDATLCARFYEECARAHAAHGFTGPADHCPALCAGHNLIIAENALLAEACPLIGAPDHSYLTLEIRAKFLRLLADSLHL